MTDNWSVQISLKSPTGALINCRGNNPEELRAQLAAVTELAPQILATEQTLHGAGVVAQGLPLSPQQPVQAPPGWGAPQSPTPLPVVPPVGYPQPVPAPFPGASGVGPSPATQPGPVCLHGIPAKHVPAGVSKTSGKPYREFWACSLDRNSQCDFKA